MQQRHNQAWTLASNGSLQVYNSPKCLAPKGASITADTPVVISTCNASASQTWTYAAATGVLKLGSLCLEVPGASTADGLQLAIDTCDGTPEQRWAFVAGPSYTPDAPSGLTASTSAVTGTSCADCTVKIYKSTGAVGAAGPGSTLVGTVTATATGASASRLQARSRPETASRPARPRRSPSRPPSRRTFAAASERRGRGAPQPARPSQRQPNAPTSGFMLAYMPLGLGYQVQTCMVTSFGCQKLNAAPDCGLFVAHASALGSGTNVPSL